jgi:uncharacterized protein (TIGR02569 family)
MPAPPPRVVLAEFGVAGGRPEALAGGQGSSWRAGDVVLKPLDMSIDALRWQADVLSRVVPDGFRVAVPLHARGGELVVEGWTGWPLLTGGHAPRWLDIVAVGERFHHALAEVERPSALLDARTDAWGRADRVAWGESPPGRFAHVPDFARLLAVRRPVSTPSQLVHGDLSGNVLFAHGLPPAVIDFSPYWRPAAYASAVVAVDAVLRHRADAELLTVIAGRGSGAQLLVRALLFRLLSERDPAAAAAGCRESIEQVCRLVEG